MQFDGIANDCFTFLSPTTATIQSKSFQSFEIRFEPKNSGIEKSQLCYKTLYNSYESPKLNLVAEGFYEPICFEELAIENEIKFFFNKVIMTSASKKRISFTLILKITLTM